MAVWLEGYRAQRLLPCLWIEKVWLLESREPLVVVRSIDLHPGVNIVWAREPESNSAPEVESAGHGVGKSSLCLLLRYCLCDEAKSITELRDKASSGFPKGGVAAKVHVDGTCWTLFRPYGSGGRSLAGSGDSLEALFANELSGSFENYAASLQAAFIDKLGITTLPGSDQKLDWQHLLAWCIRDQKTRFDGFFHWRDGDGLGFRRYKQDPPIFVRAILGLLDHETDSLMREIRALEGRIERVLQSLPDLEHEPVYELRRLESRIRRILKASDDEPVAQTTVSTSLQGLFAQWQEQAEHDEAEWEQQTVRLEEELGDLQGQLNELISERDVCLKTRDVARAALEGNESAFQKLAGELQELQKLAGQCKHGKVEFDDCTYVINRRSAPNLQSAMDQRSLAAERPQREKALEAATQKTAEAVSCVQQQQWAVDTKRKDVRRLQMQANTSQIDRKSLTSLWDEFQARLSARQQGTDTAALRKAQEDQVLLTDELNIKRSGKLLLDQNASARQTALEALATKIAMRILGKDGHFRFRLDADERPFELILGGEAYSVVEVLLGDFASLLDSAVSAGSFFPGLLVHDCPREADMSQVLYHAFLQATAEGAEQLRAGDQVPFQYIVTTTSPPPESLQTPAHIVLELFPGQEDKLLFKKRLAPQLPGLA